MTTTPLATRPGIDIVKTPLLNEGGFSDCNQIRWFDGLLQKLGGCSRLSSYAVTGTCTALHPFTDLNENNYIGVGTSTSIQLYSASPLVYPMGVSNIALSNITVVSGSNTVTVVDTTYTPAVGQNVTITNALLLTTSPYYSIIQGNFTVSSVNTLTNSWTFNLPSAPSFSGNPLTLGFYTITQSGGGGPTILLYPQGTSTSWISYDLGLNVTYEIILAGSGLTPDYLVPGSYQVIYDSSLAPPPPVWVIDATSPPYSATSSISPVQENGNLANIVYGQYMEYNPNYISIIPPSTTTDQIASGSGHITVTSGSSTVTVVDASYSPIIGEVATFVNALQFPVDGVAPTIQLIQGTYPITSVNTASTSWTFSLSSVSPVSTSSWENYHCTAYSGFSAVQVSSAYSVGYQMKWGVLTTVSTSGITINPGIYAVGTTNFGSGAVNSITPGTAVSSLNVGPVFENAGNAEIIYGAPSAYTGVWSLDNWGENLVGAPQGGPIYSWVPPLPDTSSFVSNGPQFSNVLFVAMPQQQMISLGTDAGGYLDPLLIRFSNVGDYTSSTAWTPLATNQAGSFRLSSGSLIVGGLQGPQQAFIWTDVDMWNMQYIGFPLVYSFNRIGQGCGLIAKRAAAQLGGALWWLGKKGAFYFDGQSVHPLPCPVWDYFYNQVDLLNLQYVFTAINSDFNEISWFFPVTGGSGVPTNYIKINIQNPSAPAWDYGVMTRYAWCDRSAVGPATGCDQNNILQAHETSNDLDGVAMSSYATTAWFKLSGGGDFITLKRIIWDAYLEGSGSPTMQVTVYVANYPNDTPSEFGPYTVTSATEYITVAARGRICKLTFASTGLGSFWRLGQPLLTTSPTGKR